MIIALSLCGDRDRIPPPTGRRPERAGPGRGPRGRHRSTRRDGYRAPHGDRDHGPGTDGPGTDGPAMTAAYSAEGWGELFLAAAGATAALSGLIFVGLSVNIRTVLAADKR